MNRNTRMIMERRMRERENREMRHGGYHDEYRDGMRMRRDYDMRDGRQGVKGTGKYGRGGSMYYGDRDYYDYPEDYARGDYGYDDDYDRREREDYERRERRRERDMSYRDIDYAYDDEDIHLSKREMQEWKRSMKNADGTTGEHYTLEQIMPIAKQMGIRFKDFDEDEFCLAVNMMYSDYCKAMRESITLPPDKELMTYIKLANAWLDDEDAPEGSEKLALYFKCVLTD